MRSAPTLKEREKTTMSIFKISKKQVSKVSDGNQGITDETTVQAEQHEEVEKYKAARAREPEEAMPEGAPREASTAPGEMPEQPVVSDTPAEDATMVDDQHRDVVVKIDGPVGKVFTDALNQMLAIEGFAAMIGADELVKHKEEGESDHADIHIGVYSGSVDLLNTEEIVKISNEITRHTNQDYIIAIEGVYGRTLNTDSLRRLAILEDVAKNGGVKVFYNKDMAVEHLKGKLK